MAHNQTSNVVATDWNAKMVQWFIKNSYVAFLLFTGLVLAGVGSLLSLRREGFPSPSINVAVITTVYPGASPTEIEQQVVKPIEAAISGIAGISEITSQAANSFGSVSVSFKAGTDFSAGLSELRTEVQSTVLPDDAERPDIIVPTFGGNISYYAVAGSGEAAALRQYGDEISKDLEAVKGVKSFKLISKVEDRLTIAWKPEALALRGLTPQDVSQAFQANNLTIPAGTVTQNGLTSTVATNATITSIEQVENLTIKVVNGVPVRMKDVATLSQSYGYQSLMNSVGFKENTDKAGKVASKPALVYELAFEDDVDILETNTKVEEILEENREALAAKSISLVTLSDVAEATQEQIDEIRDGAIGGPIGDGPFANAGFILGGIWLIMLSMLVMVSWRAAIISTLAIPLSLLFTFLALQLQGVTLNTLTLFSMVLALGLIVDPAIVVLEAIQRELDLGKRGRDAVIAAMNTIGTGVFVAVLTSMIVFVPFGVVSGIFGEIIRYIPVTIIPALFASYLVPVFFLTFAAQRYLKPSRYAKDDEAIGNLWAAARWFIRTNTAILKKPVLQVLIIAVAVIAPLGITGYLFASQAVVPVQFSSPIDADSMTVRLEYPENFSDDKKREVISKVETILAEETSIQRYFPFELDGSFSISAWFLPRDLRETDSPKIVDALNVKLDALENPAEKVFITASADSVGTPQQEFPVAVNIFDDSLEDLKKAAIATGDVLRDQEKVTRVEDGFTGTSSKQIEVVLNREKLNTLGIPAILVAQTLNGVIGETEVGKFEREIDGAPRTVEVLLTNASKPETRDAIASTVLLATPQGVVRVSDVATVSEVSGFSGIQRLNGSRFVTVKAKVQDELKDAAAPQAAVRDFWTKEKLAEFNLREDALESRGSGDEFIKSFQDLFIALGVAMILLYITLVIFLKSFSQPFIILFAVPLTFLGVFPALTLVGGQFGFLEILGIITLSGIVVNVGIFLLDLANQKRAEGMDYKQAIAEASGIRFRPIILTKLTTLGGLLPLILFAPFWQSLATVVAAGVLVSGLCSLFTTPILYSWFIGGKQRVTRGIAARRQMKRA
jgi:HAE1 family hydrophobic/amphiphilic exporter-1